MDGPFLIADIDSRATTLPPTTAWIAISNNARGMTSSDRRVGKYNDVPILEVFAH